MVTTLGVAEEIDDYGSTHGEDLVVPLTMLDRNHHPTSSKHPSSILSWKTKKVMLGIIGLTAAVVSGATLFWSVLTDSSSGLAQTGQSFLLQFYPYVTITNETPYNQPSFSDSEVVYVGCNSDVINAGLNAGQTWTASSRGLCLVYRINATLMTGNFPDPYLRCAPYTSSGTAYSIYSIIMKGDDACCVLSSHEIQKCP